MIVINLLIKYSIALIKRSKGVCILREEGSSAERPSICITLKVALELLY